MARAPSSQGGSHRFESCCAHLKPGFDRAFFLRRGRFALSSQNAWQRNGIGIIAVMWLLLGAFLTLSGWEGAGYAQWENISWRLSAVFAFWWLAYPEFRRLPRWTWLIIPAVLLLIALGAKRLIAILPLLVRVSVGLAPLLAVLWVLWRMKPRRK